MSKTVRQIKSAELARFARAQAEMYKGLDAPITDQERAHVVKVWSDLAAYHEFCAASRSR